VTALPILFVRMLRYRIAAMVWMFMLLGAAARGGLEHISSDYLLAAIVLGASYVAATTVNDVADKDIDKVNHPNDHGRPLVTGEARERELYVLHVLAVCLALASAAPLGSTALALAGVSLAIGWIYSLPPFLLSHRSALAPVALGLAYVIVPYALGVLVREDPLGVGDLVFAASLFALFVARITLKDFRDQEGDALYGKPTLLLRFGKGVTCLVSLSALCLGDVLLVSFLRPAPLLALLVQAFVLAAASRIYALWRASEPRAEQIAIGIGARLGNGLLLTVLAWLILSAEGASVAERSGVVIVLASAFALSFLVLVSRPDQAVIGYKG
jgi:4-hydroxybenzoate polyprenyltransferase